MDVSGKVMAKGVGLRLKPDLSERAKCLRFVVLSMMEPMKPEERKEVIDSIEELYCLGCGERHSPQCQCWNDS